MKELIQISIIAIALSVDAVSATFAVGLRAENQGKKLALQLAIPFGFFQGAMVLLGAAIGLVLSKAISDYGAVLGFFLLLFIGLKTIREGLSTKDDEKASIPNAASIGLMSIATSIDALVVGATISILSFPVVLSAFIVGITTFIFCFTVYFLSRRLGKHFGKNVEVIGGVVLILIGVSLLFF